MMLIGAVVIPFFNSLINKTSIDLGKARAETSALQTKQRVLQAVINENGKEIDQDLEIISKFIPLLSDISIRSFVPSDKFSTHITAFTKSAVFFCEPSVG